MLSAALWGLATGLSLIVAIGAQNAFVLRQGLSRRHVFAVCLTCAVSDALLIAGGVAGFGAVVAQWPWLPELLRWAGGGFLVVYGALRLRAARAGTGGLAPAGAAGGLPATLAVCLAFTWANPHVWLDTFGLIGAISTDYAPGGPRLAFALGAMAASVLFFFSLGYGARLLAPLMRRPRAWQLLDLGIGLVMWAIAARLLLGG